MMLRSHGDNYRYIKYKRLTNRSYRMSEGIGVDDEH